MWRRDEPLLLGLGQNFSLVEAPAIVGNLDTDVARLRESAQQYLGRRILSRGPARLGGFDPVIDGIANHVHERVGQFLDDVAVEFGVIAASFEIHLLTVLARQVAHQTRHFLKQYSYRNHAHGHGRFLDPFCNAFELRKIAQQPWSADLLYFRIVPDHGLGDDHLAHHIQQVVEFSDVNFYRPRIAGSRRFSLLASGAGFTPISCSVGSWP